MVTRLYFPSSGISPVAPTPDDVWDNQDDFVILPTSTTKQDTELTTRVVAWPTNDASYSLWWQFISPPLATDFAFSDSHFINLIIGSCQEATTGTNTTLVYVLRVVSNDGSEVRGTLHASSLSAEFWPGGTGTEACTRGFFETDQTFATVSASAGDRLILEIGAHSDGAAILNTVEMRIGDTSAVSDFTLTTDLTTDLVPWWEINDDLTFAEEISDTTIPLLPFVQKVKEPELGLNLVDVIYAPRSVPYLVINDITWMPDNPTVGDNVIFMATITNHGYASTPDDTIVGCRFDIDGMSVSFSDNYATPLPVGSSVNITANGGFWKAVPGVHIASVIVDDTNRIPSKTYNPNSTFSKLITVSSNPRITTICDSLASFTDALDNGDRDVTLVAAITAPANGVNIPRIASGRVVRCAGEGIINRGDPAGPVLRSDGSDGQLTLIGVRVDGGWRDNMREGEDDQSNYFLENFNYLRIENCVTCYSYSTGWDIDGCQQLEIVNSTVFACPCAVCHASGVRDYLFEGNLVQHCGDAIWSTRYGSIGNNDPPVTRSIICRNNVFRDGFGIQGHGGAGTGTINGKPSQVLIEGNTFEACGLYGFYFYEDPESDEPWAPPRNIIVRNNTWSDIRSTTHSSSDQQIGVALLLDFPDTNYDSTLQFIKNTFICNVDAQGQTLQSQYSWGQLNSPDKPPDSLVPGASMFQGFFDKMGFNTTEVFDLTNVGYRNDGGTGASTITVSGNVWIGTWTNVL